MSRRNYGVSAETFVMTWQTSSSAAEVSRRLGIPVNRCHTRASKYRAKGIKLKPLGKRGRSLDVRSLTELAESLAPAGGSG
jgi:hypothetical protein